MKATLKSIMILVMLSFSYAYCYAICIKYINTFCKYCNVCNYKVLSIFFFILTVYK